MQIGVSFPTHEAGTDRGAVRAFAQAAEDLGYDHLISIDHIVGVHEESHPGYLPIKGVPAPIYLLQYPFHELLVLLGFIAGVTERLELFTGILILPQRQTALVAKQTAEIDILCGGRLRLGVAVGHTDIEFQALGVDFHQRAAMIEEQIEVLRLLWTEPVVKFKGQFHDLDAVGLNPRPLQRPIPIWMGGWSDSVLRRAARLADGLMAPVRMDDMRQYLRDEGRDPDAFGFTGGVKVGPDDLDKAIEAAKAQQAMGVTHLSVGTEMVGYTSMDEHVDALRRFKEAYDG